MARVSKAAMLTIVGSEAVDMWMRDPERSIVESSSPPDILAKYDQHAYHGSVAFLTCAENELLAELKRHVTGQDFGSDAPCSAADVLRVVDELRTELISKQMPPLPT